MRRAGPAAAGMLAAALGALACAAFGGASGLRVQPPPADAAPLGWDAALRGYRIHVERLLPVADRLLSAAPELCGAAGHVPRLGLALVSRREVAAWVGPEVGSGGDAGLAAAATRSLGVGEGATVVAVVSGSRAAQLGLRAGDRIRSVAGEEVEDTASLRRALRRAGEETVVGDVARDGASLELSVPYQPACDVPWRLVPNAAPWVRVDEEGVAVSTGALDATEDDDELAFLFAAAAAHRLLGHPLEAASRRQAEADYLALYLAARAGYDPAASLALAARWRERSPARLPGAASVLDGGPGRSALLEATLRELEARRRAGVPLLPTSPR